MSRDYVNAMFVISSFFATLGPMVLGIVLDTYGPRVCSIVSILIVVVGSATFGSSNLETSPMFIPAMCLIAFGGPGVQSAIIHLSNLFPEWKASTTAIITGSFQLSFFMFYIFDQLWSTHGMYVLPRARIAKVLLSIVLDLSYRMGLPKALLWLWASLPFSYRHLTSVLA